MSKPYRILVVDDEPSLLLIVTKRLESEGFMVTTAEDGEEALQKVKLTPPHLIILDVMMPKLDGYEVCKRLKQDPQTQAIPIIFLSAKSKESWKKQGLELGASAFLTKPFKSQELLAEIRKLLP